MAIMDRDRPAPSRRLVEMLLWFLILQCIFFNSHALRPSLGYQILPIVALGGQ